MTRQIYYATVFAMGFSVMAIELAGLEIVVPDKAEIAKARELTKPCVDKWLEVGGPYGPEIINIISDYGAK